MPVLDSEYFPAGGGSVIKPYVSGMSVKVTDTVRSAKNFLPFIRKKSTPTSLVITSDPADLKDDFIVDDPTTSIGSIQSLQNSLSSADMGFWRNGQYWLRSGVYQPAVNYQNIPPFAKTYFDYWTGVYTPAQVGMSGSLIVDVVGNGKGRWMAVNSDGVLFKSTADGYTWTSISGITTTAEARLASNGTDRWWLINNTGQVYVTDNFGDTWTLQSSLGGTTPSIFKFMNGRLWWAPNTTYTISQTTGQLSFASSMADTNAVSPSWTGHFYNLSQAVPYFAAGTTANIELACCDNVNTIWFVGKASNNYMCIFTLNIATGTWYIGSVGAMDTIQGLNYDETVNQAWVYWSYGNAGQYESQIGHDAGQNTTNNPFYPSGTYSEPAPWMAYGIGGVFARRGGSSFLMLGELQQVNFRYTSAVGQSTRTPAVNGSFGGNYSFSGTTTPIRGIAHAGDTTIIFGKSITRSIAAVGVATPRIASGGQVDYIRII